MEVNKRKGEGDYVLNERKLKYKLMGFKLPAPFKDSGEKRSADKTISNKTKKPTKLFKMKKLKESPFQKTHATKNRCQMQDTFSNATDRYRNANTLISIRIRPIRRRGWDGKVKTRSSVLKCRILARAIRLGDPCVGQTKWMTLVVSGMKESINSIKVIGLNRVWPSLNDCGSWRTGVREDSPKKKKKQPASGER